MNGNATSVVTYAINPAAGQSYTFAGTISDVEFNGRGNATGNASPINVTFSGQGTEVLTGANPYTGTTTISSGTLELGNANAVSGSIVANNAAGNGLTFASGLGTANVGGLSGSGNIALVDLSGGSLLLSVNGAGATTYSGALSGIGGLNNAGGSLLLTNANSNYSGGTTISGGALVLASTSVLTSSWQNSGSISVSTGGRSASPPARLPASLRRRTCLR